MHHFSCLFILILTFLVNVGEAARGGRRKAKKEEEAERDNQTDTNYSERDGEDKGRRKIRTTARSRTMPRTTRIRDNKKNATYKNQHS